LSLELDFGDAEAAGYAVAANGAAVVIGALAIEQLVLLSMVDNDDSDDHPGASLE
jgi:hypothetical protein